MAQATINSYYGTSGTFSSEFTSGLGTIIGAYPNTITMSQLIAEVYSIIESTFYSGGGGPSTQVGIELNAIITNTVNSYVNSLIKTGRSTFNVKQLKFIDLLINPTVISTIPVLSLNNWLLDVEDNITKSDLTVAEQMPLLMATAIGQAAYSYVIADVALTTTAAWKNYYTSVQAQNYANIPFWVAAAMEGALVGYGANVAGLVEPTVNMFSNTMISALAGALAVYSAKVMLQVIPRIQNPLILNTQTIANIGEEEKRGITGTIGIADMTALYGGCKTDNYTRWHFSCPACPISVGCPQLTIACNVH